MRLRTQFIITMLLFGMILVFIGAAVILTDQQMEKASRQASIASSIAQGASELGYLSNDYLIYRESQQLKRWQSRFASFSAQVASLRADRPEQQALVRNIQANQQRLKEVFDSVASSLGNPPPNQRVALDAAFLQVSWSRMAVQSQGLISDASRLSQLLRAEVDHLVRMRTILMFVMVGVFGAFLLSTYIQTFRRTLKSIAALQAGTVVIGSGNLDFVIEEGKNDEIGELARAFNRMTVDLKAVTASKADLEREMVERNRAEDALRESEQRWATTLASIGDAVIATDVEAKITFMNTAAEELTGWTLGEAAAGPVTTVFNIVNEQTRRKVENPVAKVLEQGGIVGLANHTLLVRKDGAEVPIDDSGAPIRDPNGKTMGVVLVFRDITGRRKAEQALIQSEDRYRTLFNTLIEGFCIIEVVFDDHGRPVDYRFLEVNPAFEKQTGLHAAQGKLMRDLAPDHETHWFEIYGKIALTGEPARFVNEAKALNRWYDVSAFRLGGTESRKVAILFNDITERKRAEEALRESEMRYRHLVQHAPAGIYEIDFTTGHFKEVNDAMCQILGYTRDELLAKTAFDILDDEGRASFASRIRLAQSGKRPDEAAEYLVRTKNGRFIWGLLNVTFRWDGGKIVGATVVAHDITDRKRMEEELRRSRDELEIKVQERTADLAGANKELQEEIARREKAEQQLLQAQKLEAIGTLTGGIAHDFNNILGAIVINSEMALFDLPGGSGIRSNLDLILKSGLRGKDLVKQMLLFSRKSEKKQEIITLTPLIKETFKLLRSSLPTTIQMKLYLETESDAVSADLPQIQQVIMNLCTNAAYAMRGTTGSIDISLQGITFGSTDLPEADMQPGDYLALSVKDTGSGMDEEVRKRIFEPFFTTKPVGEGTGLGLSVVYGIVKNHKGSITVYSEPGKGSIFRVYLPKVDTGASAAPEAPKSNPIPRGNERILLVDDEDFNIKTVRNMLQHLGYKVTALMDSQRALKLFSENTSEFDLVITDQTMPFLTGEDLGKELMRIRPDIPIILCTGYSDLISSEKAKALGFRGYIMKPFTVREGADLVRRVLDQKEAE